MPDKVYTQKKIPEMVRLLRKGLSAQEGKVWKNKRKILSLVFNFEFLKANIPNMRDVTI